MMIWMICRFFQNNGISILLWSLLTRLEVVYLEHNPLYELPDYREKCFNLLPSITKLDISFFCYSIVSLIVLVCRKEITNKSFSQMFIMILNPPLYPFSILRILRKLHCSHLIFNHHICSLRKIIFLYTPPMSFTKTFHSFL